MIAATLILMFVNMASVMLIRTRAASLAATVLILDVEVGMIAPLFHKEQLTEQRTRLREMKALETGMVMLTALPAHHVSTDVLSY